MRGRVVGPQMNCALVLELRGIKLTQVCPRHAAVVMGLRGIRANRQSHVVAAHSLGQPANPQTPAPPADAFRPGRR